MGQHLDTLTPSDEMLDLAKQLLGRVKEFNTTKPNVDIQSSMKGIGAVVRELEGAGGPLSPSELATRTGVTDARIANILRVLQERGLVERKQSASDKRRAEISLTSEGKADCKRRKEELERAAAAFLTRLGKEDAIDLIRITGKALATLEALRAEGYEPRPPMESEYFPEKVDA